MRFTKLFAVAAILALLAIGVQAQGVGSSGELTGVVYDPSGAVVAKTTVTATASDKGIVRTATSDEHGRFRIAGLQPGNYNVTVQTSSFQGGARDVAVTVGEVATLDLHLKIAGVKGQVEVTTADVPVVETERGHQSNTISQAYINDLPIDRRDYLTFTLLTPGVSDSSRLAGDQNFRVKQTPQSNLSFYGSNGRGNNVTVDGAEANDDAGGVRLTMSQDAIQEFQINRSNYSAEMGSASGAAINIVSKSGSNRWHGSVYGFFRDDALDSRDPFAFKPALAQGAAYDPTQPDSFGKAVKNGLSRQQFGGTLGFPLKKDKSFLFLAFEGLTEDSQQSVPVLQNTTIFRPQSSSFNNQQAVIDGLAALGATPVPCLTGQPALPAATCAGILNNILTISNVPAASPLNKFLVNQFESDGGVFPFPTHQYLASARFDHRFRDKDQASLRFSFGSDIEHNPDLQSLTGLSRGSSVHSYDDTLQGSWFHQFSGFTQNELRAQFNYYNLDIIPNTPGQAGLDMPGFLNSGTNIFQPADTISHRWEFADNMTMIRGRHTMKFGGSELVRQTHADSHTFFPGRFVFGNLPGGILSPCLQVPAACGLVNTNPAFLNPLQNASLGLPIFYEQGFGDASVGGSVYRYSRPLSSLFWQDSWQVRPNLTLNYGLRYDVDSQTAALPTDKDNVAPRVAIAWDPFSDHKTVVRAGYGLFYSNVYGQIPDVVHTLGEGAVFGETQIANLLVPLSGAPGFPPALTSAAIFQTLFAQGKIQCTVPTPGTDACITPGDLTQFGINVTHTGALPLPVFFRGQLGYQNPYSHQASFGIEREISNGFTVSGSYIYVHTLHLPVAEDTNLLPGAPNTTVTLANGAPFTYKNWAAPQCTVVDPFSCFQDPFTLQNNVYASGGSALYQGGIFEVKKRFSNNFTLMGNYTYSRAEDTNTDFNSDFGPQDNTNLNLDHALSEFDQRHKVVVAGIVQSPWKTGKDASMSEKIFGGFQFSPILRYNSGHPFNLLTIEDVPGVAGNGDRHYTNDRPIGAPRNSGRGPDYLAFDMRLSRGFKLGESGNLQFLVEAFNLFNRTNYAAVNNYVPSNLFLPTTSGGVGLTSFNVSGTNKSSANSPLGFTSAFPRQEFQLGLRYSF